MSTQSEQNSVRIVSSDWMLDCKLSVGTWSRRLIKTMEHLELDGVCIYICNRQNNYNIRIYKTPINLLELQTERYLIVEIAQLAN